MSNLAVVLLRTIFVFSACVAVMSGKFLHQKRAIINDERRDLVNIDTRSDKAIRGTPTYCRCANQPVVVFLARLVNPVHGTIPAKAIVVFENVLENIDNDYNKHSGVFTAPIRGLYHFTASARQSRTGYLHLGLFKNAKEMAISVAVNYNSLTISVALILDKKDHVYVKNISKKSSGIVGVGQSYFSGHLVQRM